VHARKSVGFSSVAQRTHFRRYFGTFFRYHRQMIMSTMPSRETKRQIGEYSVDYADKPNTYEGNQDLAKRFWELCESKSGAATGA
jgi:hypothetical protein